MLNFEKREEFRRLIKAQENFTSLSVGYVFNMGYPRKVGGNVFMRHGKRYVLDSPAGKDLLKYDGKWREVIARVSQEIVEYDDVVMGDYEDTYLNLTRKLYSGYRWAGAFCKDRAKFFIMMDDDHSIILRNFESFVEKHPYEEMRKTYYGEFVGPHGVWRVPTTKKYVSPLDQPWGMTSIYPVGYGHIIGVDIMPRLAIVSAYTKDLMQLDDGLIGYLVDRLHLKTVKISGLITMEEGYIGNGWKTIIGGVVEVRAALILNGYVIP